MKSSRLSPAGRLQGGACMPGSRSEYSGCASRSSACPVWRQGKPCCAQAECPLGLTSRWAGGVQASWVGAQGPRKQATAGICLQAAHAGSQRHNGPLVRPWAGASGGSGGGEGEARARREAGQEPAGQSLGHAGLLAGPSGVFAGQCSPLPQRESRGNWGSWQRRAWALGALIKFPLLPPGPV